MTLESGRKIKSIEKGQPGAQAQRRNKEGIIKRFELNARTSLKELAQISVAEKLRIFADLLEDFSQLTKPEQVLFNAIKSELPLLLGINSPEMMTWEDLGGSVIGQGAPGAERHTNVGSLAEATEAGYEGYPARGSDSLTVPGLLQGTATGTLHIPRRNV